jgi:hypothetical protein
MARKLALALDDSAVTLIFEADERGLPKNSSLRLKQSSNRPAPKATQFIKAVIDGM